MLHLLFFHVLFQFFDIFASFLKFLDFPLQLLLLSFENSLPLFVCLFPLILKLSECPLILSLPSLELPTEPPDLLSIPLIPRLGFLLQFCELPVDLL